MAGRHQPEAGADSASALMDRIRTCQVPGCVDTAVAHVAIESIFDADFERDLCERHRDGLIALMRGRR